MKAIKLAVAAVSLLVFASCNEVEIKDGRIPQDYLPEAQKFVGSYHGKFDYNVGDLVMSLDGDKLVLAFKGEKDNDILGRGCESYIGDLKYLGVTKNSKNEYTIDSATFDFNPNRCSDIEGRQLALTNIRIKGEAISFRISILERIEYRWVEYCNVDPYGRWQCTRRPEQTPVYMNGSFAR